MFYPATVVTSPTFIPIDRNAIKLFLRLDGNQLDDEIDSYILAAVAEVERITGTRLAEQEVELRADSFADLSHLPIGPVKSIVSITYRDLGGVSQTVDSGRYEVVGSGLDVGILAAAGTFWPPALIGQSSIVVRLGVGYADGALPATLDLALKMLIRSKFEGTLFDLFAATANDRIWL